MNGMAEAEYTTIPEGHERGYFMASYDNFLAALPPRPMNQNELARLAYFAGAAAAFSGLHQHEELCESENIDDEEAQAIMQKFALEPFEFLHKYGIQVTK